MKQQAIQHCKQYLSDLSLSQFFSLSLFDAFFQKFGAGQNAYQLGITAGDYIIANAKP